MLTGDARPRFFDELCSRSGGDAREAMTVGCKPTRPCAHGNAPAPRAKRKIKKIVDVRRPSTKMAIFRGFFNF